MHLHSHNGSGTNRTPTLLLATAPLLINLLTLTNAWSTIPTSYLPRTLHSTTLHSTSSSSENNIVFRPSEDPSAFDSFQIGTPRIHRYSSNADDSEYIMWYHGRSSQDG